MAMVSSWRFDLDKNWQIGAEQNVNQNSANIRATLGQNVQIDQQHSLAVLQYRWQLLPVAVSILLLIISNTLDPCI
jgi:hypothetical protein